VIQHKKGCIHTWRSYMHKRRQKSLILTRLIKECLLSVRSLCFTLWGEENIISRTNASQPPPAGKASRSKSKRKIQQWGHLLHNHYDAILCQKYNKEGLSIYCREWWIPWQGRNMLVSWRLMWNYTGCSSWFYPLNSALVFVVCSCRISSWKDKWKVA